jgi:hypothetical protein
VGRPAAEPRGSDHAAAPADHGRPGAAVHRRLRAHRRRRDRRAAGRGRAAHRRAQPARHRPHPGLPRHCRPGQRLRPDLRLQHHLQ